MYSSSRREFLATLGAFTLNPLARTEPNLILHNAVIYTVDDSLPRAQAIAIADDRFLAVGSNDEILPLATARTRKIDLGGKTVVPGFIDAHAHPVESGLDHLRKVPCDFNSIAEIQAAIRKKAGQTPKGQWILGFLYDDGKTPRFLTRQDLDDAAPDHPVFVVHRGGHTAIANSMAFRIAGIDDKTPDPQGGKFDHDSEGHLTGRISDFAQEVFWKLTDTHPTRDDYRAAVKFISKMFNSKGVTSACDADGTTADLQGYQDARESGDLSLRIYCHIDFAALDHMIAAGVHTGFGDEWVRLGAIKQYVDGSISERTARLSQPYIGIPNYYGLALGTRQEFYETSRKAHEAGWQLATHANGDIAIDECLGVYEQVQRELPRRDARYRLEHCTLVNDSLVQRMRALGAIPVPFAGYVYFHGDILHFYGKERAQHMFAMRSFLDAGIRVPDSSDYAASPSFPMMWMQSQITRADMKGDVWGASQKITAAEALRCGTLHGAYASFEEKTKGSITPGKLADLVVFGDDPLTADPASLLNITVERTMVGGKWVYES